MQSSNSSGRLLLPTPRPGPAAKDIAMHPISKTPSSARDVESSGPVEAMNAEVGQGHSESCSGVQMQAKAKRS